MRAKVVKQWTYRGAYEGKEYEKEMIVLQPEDGSYPKMEGVKREILPEENVEGKTIDITYATMYGKRRPVYIHLV